MLSFFHKNRHFVYEREETGHDIDPGPYLLETPQATQNKNTKFLLFYFVKK